MLKNAIAIRHVMYEDLGSFESHLINRGINLKYIDKQQQSLFSLMKNYDQSSIKIFPTSTKKILG